MILKRKKFVFVGLTVIILMFSLTSKFNLTESATLPVFTLVAKTNGGGVRADYLNFLKQHLARIRINVDVQILDWPTFVGELLAFYDYDIFTVGLIGEGLDPDSRGVYDENGSLNMFGYHTSMDWDEELGTGKNEWYMQQGTLVMAPDCEERVQHYWEWEQYIMDEILPIKPTLISKKHVSYWSNLYGFDYPKGLLQSWGQMGWSGTHLGQTSTNEFRTPDFAWSDLNPLFQDETSENFISRAIMDNLVWYDSDKTAWPHLATDWLMINDTHLRLTFREGIKWQTDPDGLFTNEIFDASDVYFTIYAWKHLSDDTQLWSWVEDMDIVNQNTLDIYIDGDPETLENEPYAPFLSTLNELMLPEHYLNQTQIADGVTPDILHPSWQKFTVDCFGTGLFEIDDFTEGVETKLLMNDDCWMLDPLIDKSDMNVEERFGNFTSGLDTLVVKQLSEQQSMILEFEIGNLDVVGVTNNPAKREEYRQDPDFEVQSRDEDIMNFFGYNMREDRAHIGSRELCPNDPTMTIGLAVRKAISYAIDVEEINEVLFGGEYQPIYHPIFNTLGIWCNPNIIRYDFNLDLARSYLAIAGYDVWENELGSGIGMIIAFTSMMIITTLVLLQKKKRGL